MNLIRSKRVDWICYGAVLLAVFITVGLLIGCLLWGQEKETSQSYPFSTEYVEKIFDPTYVHELDIRLPQVNWDYLVRHATEEQYVICEAVIDGESFANVAIRPKGNSSLKAIKTQDSDRFSFKLEFDHYQENGNYYGLDKLALNNLGQDKSGMKDFLTYQMMNEIGVAAPLSSYMQVKLNGEDFGLYLAVEGIEDSFAYRNYGEEFGNIYKPECFEISTVTPKAFINTKENPFEQDFTKLGPGERADILGTMVKSPFESAFGELMEAAALKYVGENFERYQVFYNSSVFDLNQEGKESLIQTIKQLNSTENPEEALDIEQVLRYLVVHNFVNNYDSYSGIFVHNYYIREYNGKLSMIPWDYNLAFGIFTFRTAMESFMGEDTPYTLELKVGQAMDDATGMVNYPIDTPTISVDMEERPLINVLLSNPVYLEQYHEIYQRFLTEFFTSGRFETLFQNTRDMIKPYVEKGQTFYTAEETEKGSKAVWQYCNLREESIRGQLAGTIPATMEGQKEHYENLVDTSYVKLADSVTFDSLVFGINSRDILEILDAIAGENEHSSAGITATIEQAKVDQGEIGKIIGRVITGSTLLKKAIGSVILGPILLILSLVVLRKGMKKVKKYQRR